MRSNLFCKDLARPCWSAQRCVFGFYFADSRSGFRMNSTSSTGRSSSSRATSIPRSSTLRICSLPH